jgi:hypothetical protein
VHEDNDPERRGEIAPISRENRDGGNERSRAVAHYEIFCARRNVSKLPKELSKVYVQT